MKQKIVLFLLVAVFSVGCFAGTEVEKVSATTDTTAPTVTFDPLDGATDVAANSNITITFDEAVRHINDSAIDDADVNALITLKDIDAGGADIAFDATINDAKQVITIDPTSDFTSEQVVCVAIGATVEDISDNAITASDATFVIVDTTAPVMISAVYKDTSDDGIVDSIDVTYSEGIGSSTPTEDEWSFPLDSNPHNLEISSVSISPDSSTDVRIAVTSSCPGDLTVIDNTIVKYTATTDGGIVDGAGNYAADGELPVRAEGYITPPDDALDGPVKPNLNSGVTLYRLDGSPRVYVIKNKKKHWIQTPKEFNAAGYNWGKVKIVSAEVLEEYPDDGETSTTELLRAVGSHKVYKINNGKRRWIKTAGEFNAAGYKWKDIKDVSPETLASYQDEVLSELLRATGSHKVYIIENGKKRWIKTAGEFNAAGHKWEDVENVDAQDLDDYPDLD